MIDRYFGTPQSFIRLGMLIPLSGAATKLYMVLWHDSERYQTREITRTTAELRDLMGGSRNSHAKARAELVRVGLIQAEPYGTEGFVFHLCNPETGKPWPEDPKMPVRYRRKHATSADIAAVPIVKSGKPPKIASAGISFAFGHNSGDKCVPTGTTIANACIPKWNDLGECRPNAPEVLKKRAAHAQIVSTRTLKD
jgi:hypothetical protein